MKIEGVRERLKGKQEGEKTEEKGEEFGTQGEGDEKSDVNLTKKIGIHHHIPTIAHI